MNKRPIIISIIAILQFIIGQALVYDLGKLHLIGLFGIPIALIFIIFAYGLWFGRRWAWWIGAFIFINLFTTNLLSIFGLRGLAINSDFNFYIIIRNIVFEIIGGFLIYSFFRQQVIDYFNFKNFSKSKAVIILLGIVLVFKISFILSLLIW